MSGVNHSGLRRLVNFRGIVLIAMAVVLSACQITPNKPRQGMVRDEQTGILYGSSIEANIVTDASFYTNRRIKIRARNTSGDLAFDIEDFADRLAKGYADKGYEPTQADDFGLLLDVNVVYSGHVQTDLSAEYGFLGSVVGGAVGAASGNPYAGAGGSLVGASVGVIAGSYATEDTYIIIADVTFGSVKKARKSKRRVTFSRSEKLKNVDDPDEDDLVYSRGFKRTYNTPLAVYAGGHNVKQSEISAEVKNRIIRVIGDLI